MKVQQLSVFLENKPGQLSAPCKLLAENAINILTLSLADTQQFGILRMIVQDIDKAIAILKDAGYIVRVDQVVAIEVEDRPGGLAPVLRATEAGGVNVEYMYAFTARKVGKGVLIFRFEDPDKAIKVLQQNGVSVVGNVELFEMVG